MTPHEISSYPILRDLLRKSCEKHAQSPALICQGQVLTYTQVRTLSLQMACYLQKKCGVEKGDRVALFLPNSMQFIVSCLAALEIGGVVVNINPLYTERELEHILIDAKPKVFIFLENFHPSVAKVPKNTLPQFLISTEVGDCYSWWRKIAIRLYLHYGPDRIASMPSSLSSKITWWSSCGSDPQAALEDVSLGLDDLAFLQYTGGTTGTPKGAMLTHGNLAANITQASSWIALFYPNPEVFRIATALPLYHIFSLTANFLTFFVLGSENLLIMNPRDLPNFLRDWRKYPVDAICGVNTLFAALLKYESFHQLDKSRLKIVIGGGMAVSSVLAQKWHERTGTNIIQAYGLTESSPAVTINPLNLRSFSKSIGQPLSRTEVRFVDENEIEVALGERGELWVRGPQVMKGYWNNSKETQEVLTSDGWLKTGDIGYQDENRLIYLVDRKKELIIISGFNVYPSEIEDLLLQHPDIEEAAVVGESDSEGGEHVVAFYSVQKGHIDPGEEELEAYCKKVLTGYKVPKKYLVVIALPKSPVGKILKKDLKKRLKESL